MSAQIPLRTTAKKGIYSINCFFRSLKCPQLHVSKQSQLPGGTNIFYILNEPQKSICKPYF